MWSMNVFVGMVPASATKSFFAVYVAASGVVGARRRAVRSTSMTTLVLSGRWPGGGKMCGAHAAKMQSAFCFD